jgi:hypothetical protein
MTKDEKAFLISLVLGDGSISLNHRKLKANTGTFRVTHSVKQRELVEYKAKRCNSILGGKQVAIREFCNNSFPGLSYNKTHRYFGILYNFIYKNGKKTYPKTILKRLNTEAFALWWMDDGCLSPKKRNGKIHAYQGFLNTYEDWDTNIIIADMFFEKFGVRPLIRKDKGSFRLEFNTTKLRVLLPILEKYSIPSMSYKFKFCTSA